MNSPSDSRHFRFGDLAGVTLAAASVFLLAYVQPVEMVRSDPAMALVAAQALLEHGTLNLDVYEDHPDFAYEFDLYNYRVKEVFGGHYYFNLGQPVVSVPIVLAANLLGYDMLVPDDEYAVQNLVSAVLTALILLLAYRLARLYLGPRAGLAVALVSTLGSSLVSTLATGLWSACFQIVLLAWILLLLARWEAAGVTVRSCFLVGSMLGGAFLIRPTAAFLAVAVLLFLLGEKDRAVALGSRLVLGLGALLAVLTLLEVIPWLRYYSPRKILPSEVPWVGLYGVTFGPSRGLFSLSPFLVPVVALVMANLRSLWGHRFLRLIVVWITLHFAGVAFKETWWGGQCFGPRLLAEVMPGFVVLTAWAWRQLSGAPVRRRAAFAAAYLVLGILAIFVHSYQALFNPATVAWNNRPNIDNPKYHGLLLSWRYPQFLASDESINERFLELERRDIGVHELGDELSHDSGDLLFVRWHQPEHGWRWSQGLSSELRFRLGRRPGAPAYLLRLHASSSPPQSVALTLNGVALGQQHFEGSAPVHRVAVVRGDLLRAGENILRLDVPGARSTEGDGRVLGIAFRSMRFVPVGDDLAVTFRDDALFARGFSVAEDGWRWTDGTEAELLFPVAEVEGDRRYAVEMVAGAFGDQRIQVLVNRRSVGELEISGPEPRVTRFEVSGEVLRSFDVNTVGFRIPGAARPEEDERLLGLRFVSLRMTDSVRSPGVR